MFQRPIRRFVHTVLLTVLFTSALHATSVIAPTFPELVAESQVIARVKVTALRAAWVDAPPGRIIKTFVTFSVLKTLKGPPSTTLTVPFLGGELDGQAMRIEGMPRFTLGQTDIIFISDLAGVRFSPLVGLMHGRYRIMTDAAKARSFVARNDGTPLESEDDVQLPQSNAASPSSRLKSVSRALSVEDFEARIMAENNRAAAPR